MVAVQRTTIEAVSAVRPLKIISLLCLLIAIGLSIVSLCSTSWLKSGSFRTGLFKECTSSNEPTHAPPFSGAPAPGKCHKPSRNSGFLTAAAVLLLVALFATALAVIFNVIGLSKSDIRGKYRWYRIATMISAFSVLLELVALIMFPVAFYVKMDEYGSRRNWEVDWSYGIAWGATLFTLGASIMLICDKEHEEINVGIAAAENQEPDVIGWPQSGGAVNLAIRRLREEGYIEDFDFEFTVKYTECDRALAAEIGIEFFRDEKMDVVVSAPCADPLDVIGSMSTYYKIPSLAWGMVTSSRFADGLRYPYLSNIMPSSLSLGYTVAKFLEMMEWSRVALYYDESDTDYTKNIIEDVESALNDYSYTFNVILKQPLPSIKNIDETEYTRALTRAKSRARIIISSISTSTARRVYLRKIHELGMDNSEYVHLMISVRSIGFGKQKRGKTKCELNCLSTGLSPFWEADDNENDGLNDELRNSATRVLVFDLSTDVMDTSYLEEFSATVTTEVTKPPINCTTDACVKALNYQPSTFCRSLHDLIYMYGMALTALYRTEPDAIQDPLKIITAMQGTFQGLTGEVTINLNNTRVPKFMLYALNKNYDQSSFMNLTYNGGASASAAYTDESQLWFWYGGKRPLAVPICGFHGNLCPQTFVAQYGALVFSISGVLAACLIFLICLFFFTMRQRKLEQDRINSEWQIPHAKLQKPPKKDKEKQSKRSLQSGPSTITENSKFTFDSEFSNYTVYYLDKEPVLATKHPATTLVKSDYDQFVKMRKLYHDNVNKFIGLSIDGPDYVAIWKMCMRGSLQDIILQGNFSMDPFFMFCIVRDIAEGLKYLHQSFLHSHANLRSATCLVNESWQVKLTDYGLGFLMEESKPSKKRQLWMAPEVLRGGLLQQQIEKPADIYSFAIIASEILTRKPAWNIQERKESVDELIYLIKKGGHSPIRPELDLDGVEVSNSLLLLVADCWNEEPADRPTADQICAILKGMMPSKNTNLMDHVFNMLEEYTTTLELEVDERTKELSAEKKKADVLLGRMLPKQVADRLKAGQTVEPEGFDSVTVFFSDVVKFTQLAAKCSPFQVVNLLNDLYSNFDSIIEEHGVYKVESIGDGYLCVSGLPIRNGFAHIKQIVEMSLAFMNYVSTFKIAHLPREKVELRIGLNSGPCVAGVVGLSMPRYCLFGDTVNTASRMESNGRPSHIHCSATAHNLLVTHYPNQYETQSRGDVIIKGKGVMETFWVHGRTGAYVPEEREKILKTPPMVEVGENFKVAQLKCAVKYKAHAMLPGSPQHWWSPEELADTFKIKTEVRNRKFAPESPSSSKRSVSPIVEAMEEKSDALYRQFRRKETLAV
ncbi:unnamed protein product [Caenorhabditis bovis]|uniref:Guanylate cyclase n=1 Tax=Caenorhabditis bovis TaxID=2654633 RepID=A0A8S1FB21_9PELO|nr:unnamed protein product [Caenorhabditis bovis]